MLVIDNGIDRKNTISSTKTQQDVTDWHPVDVFAVGCCFFPVSVKVENILQYHNTFSRM